MLSHQIEVFTVIEKATEEVPWKHIFHNIYLPARRGSIACFVRQFQCFCHILWLAKVQCRPNQIEAQHQRFWKLHQPSPIMLNGLAQTVLIDERFFTVMRCLEMCHSILQHQLPRDINHDMRTRCFCLQLCNIARTHFLEYINPTGQPAFA